MARVCNKTSSHYFAAGVSGIGAAIAGASVVALSAWVRVTGTLGTGTGDNRVINVIGDGSTFVAVLSVRNTGAVRCTARPAAAETSVAAESTATIATSGTWQQIGVILDFAAKTSTPIVNGVASNPSSEIAWTADAVTLGTPSDSDGIGATGASPTSAQIFPGALAGVAVFVGDPGEAAWTALAEGTAPDRVTLPDGVTLVRHYPLTEDGPVVPDTAGGTQATANSRPAWEPDPYLAPLGGSARTVARDTFGGSGDLAAHTTDDGVAWEEHPSASNGSATITSGSVGFATTAAGTARYRLDTTLTSFQSRVSLDLTVTGTPGAADSFAVLGKIDATDSDWFEARYLNGAISIQRVVGGVATQIATASRSLTAGTYRLDVIFGSRNTLIYLDGRPVVWGANNSYTGIDWIGSIGLSAGSDSAKTSPFAVSDLTVTQGVPSWIVGVGSLAVAGGDFAAYHSPSTLVLADGTTLVIAESRSDYADNEPRGVVARRASRADLLAGVVDPWSAVIDVEPHLDTLLCGNPVSFVRDDGVVECWYGVYPTQAAFGSAAVGTSGATALIYRRTSSDGGLTWSDSEDVTASAKSETASRYTLGPQGRAARDAAGNHWIAFTETIGGDTSTDRVGGVIKVAANGTISRVSTGVTGLVESHAIALGGDRLAVCYRLSSPTGLPNRTWVFSEDDGATWSSPATDARSPQPTFSPNTGAHQPHARAWIDGQVIGLRAMDYHRRNYAVAASTDAAESFVTASPLWRHMPYGHAPFDDAFSTYGCIAELDNDHLVASYIGGTFDVDGIESSGSSSSKHFAQRWLAVVIPRSLTGLEGGSSLRAKRRRLYRAIVAARGARPRR